MFKIPLRKIQNSSATTKGAVKQANNFVFNDKIVNRITQPTLFNVQSAATAMELKMGAPVDRRARRKNPTQKNLIQLTNETLLFMNVTTDTLQKDFSLLQQNSFVLPDPNPQIIDMELIDNIENSPANVKNHFNSENDPIFQLDDENNSGIEYGTIQRNGNITPQLDLSKVVSDLNIVNQSPDFFGKNKYF